MMYDIRLYTTCVYGSKYLKKKKLNDHVSLMSVLSIWDVQNVAIIEYTHENK